jgi:hypothetical protein
MTVLAVNAKGCLDMIRFLCFEEALVMAALTFLRGARKLFAKLVLVARLAVCGGMHADKGETALRVEG